jgi:hypothetical protein
MPTMSIITLRTWTDVIRYSASLTDVTANSDFLALVVPFLDVTHATLTQSVVVGQLDGFYAAGGAR